MLPGCKKLFYKWWVILAHPTGFILNRTLIAWNNKKNRSKFWLTIFTWASPLVLNTACQVYIYLYYFVNFALIMDIVVFDKSFSW